MFKIFRDPFVATIMAVVAIFSVYLFLTAKGHDDHTQKIIAVGILVIPFLLISVAGASESGRPVVNTQHQIKKHGEPNSEAHPQSDAANRSTDLTPIVEAIHHLELKFKSHLSQAKEVNSTSDRELKLLLQEAREQQKYNGELLKNLSKQVDTLRESSRPASAPESSPDSSFGINSEKLGELSGSLSEAMKQISVRDTQIDILATNVNRSNIQRNLVRLTQVLEVARSLKVRVADGKSDAKDSFDFIVDDMDSALTDQGVEAFEVAVGARVAELPAGSFAAISVVDAPEDSLRGTVKEVRSRCYFIPEEGKKPRYIAPAKVILYRA